jgi:cation:H+ antiporter
MDFLINFLALGASLAILIWGADKFVDSSSLLAKKLGINELTIGLTVVALGTSAPEIFVGISSVLNQSENIAMGAVVGSNISNIALIFGVSCIGIALKPKETPIIQLAPFLLSAAVLGITLHDLKVSIIDSILLLIVFLYFLYVIINNKSEAHINAPLEKEDQNKSITFLFLTIGLIALIFGSRYAVIYAEKIAILLDISELIIGLTIVAIGTSLPELAATISAIIKKKTDMVVGNVIGSNVLNITLVVPIIGFFSNVQLGQVLFSRDYFLMSIATIIFTLVVIIYSKNINLTKIRFMGVLFLIGYLGYILKLSNLI